MLKRIIPLVLVLIILGVGYAYLKSTDQEQSNNMQELYRQTEPLQQQKDSLVNQKQSLTKQKQEVAGSYIVETRDMSTLQILFRESSVRLFNHVYPLMRERGLTGVIGISKDDYPGAASRDKISLEHYNRLIMDGWGACIVYDGSQRLDGYLRSLKNTLDRKEVAFPTSIYFTEKKAAYDSETMDPILAEYGIDTIIRNSEDGRSETVTQVEDFWRTGAMPWNYTGIDTDLEYLAVTDGGNLTITCSFVDIWDGILVPTTNTRKAMDMDIQSAFVSFLNTVAGIMSKESSIVGPTPTPAPTPTPGPNGEILKELQLRVTIFETAREAHLEAQNSAEKQLSDYYRMQEEIDEEIADIDAQIAELEKQITEIYTAFNIKGYTQSKIESGEAA